MEEMMIDARNAVAGRLASRVSKELLKGKKVYVVNAEKAVVSGDPKYTMRIFEEKIQRGDPYNGPFYPRRPEMILRRMVRGMLSYKKPRGREAFKRLRVFISVPEELRGREPARIKEAENMLENKYITLEKLSRRFGVEIQEPPRKTGDQA